MSSLLATSSPALLVLVSLLGLVGLLQLGLMLALGMQQGLGAGDRALHVALGLLLAGSMIAPAVGLLRRRSWGWHLAVWCVVGQGLMSIADALLDPLVAVGQTGAVVAGYAGLLYLLSLDSVRRACLGAAAGSLLWMRLAAAVAAAFGILALLLLG